MYKWIIKKTIKNSDNIEDPQVREKHGFLGTIFSLVFNLLLFSSKLIMGLIIGSISVIGDAINNLADLASSIVGIIGVKLSNKPADEKHPFGHQRIEYLSVIMICVVIFVIVVQLVISSIKEIINPTELEYSLLTIIILIISILMKLYLATFNKFIAKKIDSPNLMATSIDARNDVFTTIVVLVGLLVFKFLNINVDGYLGIFVSAFLIHSIIMMIRETVDSLIGVDPNPQLVADVSNYIYNHDGIIGMHDMICHMYGPHKLFMSLHVEVDGATDILLTHELIDVIERKVKKEFNINLVIHMDPIDLKDENLNTLRVMLKEIIKEIDANLKAYDFRYFKANNEKKIIFDLTVPHNYNLNKKEIKQAIENKIKLKEVDFEIIINFNHPFCQFDHNKTKS